MTAKSYTTLSDWLSSDIHIDQNVDIGPQGDVEPNYLSIKGDRYRHDRINIADLPKTTIKATVKASVLENVLEDLPMGDPLQIKVRSNSNFAADDNIIIEDSAGNEEVGVIDSLLYDNYLVLKAPVSGTFDTDDSTQVSVLSKVYVESSTGFTANDIVSLQTESDGEDFEYYNCKIRSITTESDGSVYFLLEKLFKEFSENDLVLNVCPSTTGSITRDSTNSPIVNLGRDYFFHHSGNDVRDPVFVSNVYTKKDSKDEILFEKPSLFYACGQERKSNQISMALSSGSDDRIHYTEFLGDDNDMVLNPIIKNSDSVIEYFRYADTATLKKVWDTRDADITITLNTSSLIEGVSCCQVDFTDDGEVCGLLPLPMNAEIRCSSHTYPLTTQITMRVKGKAGNPNGDFYITAIAADDTSRTEVFADVIQNTSTQNLSFDISDWIGRKYIRALVCGISLDIPPGSGTIYIDSVKPFIPMSWDEIVEDPAVLKGKEIGSMACYYTARERPRQTLLSDLNLEGQTMGSVIVTDESDFDVGDTVVIYSKRHHEIGKVFDTSSGQIDIEYIGLVDDNTSTFNYAFDRADQAMIANNTYRTNKIGGSYVNPGNSPIDLSDWIRLADPILEPNTDLTKGDSVSVSSPSVEMIGNSVYMIYSGNSGGYENIFAAFSTDFVNFTRLNDSVSILPAGIISAWDEDGKTYPDLNISLPDFFLGVTGLDGSDVKSIGSYMSSVDFLKKNPQFTIGMFIYCGATLGMPPDNGAVLFDMGCMRIELDKWNRPNFYIKLRGNDKEECLYPDTFASSDVEESRWYWTVMTNRWYYLSLSFDGYQAIMELTGNYYIGMLVAGPHAGWGKYQLSKFVLADDVAANATTLTVMRNPYWVDLSSNDSHPVPEDNVEMVIDSKALVGTDYENKRFKQAVWIDGVTTGTPIDGIPTWDITLRADNPVGPWGFQQQLEGMSANIWIGSTTDTSPLYQSGYGQLGTELAFVQTVDFGNKSYLDETAIRNITFGNNIANDRGFTTGIIAHAEILGGVQNVRYTNYIRQSIYGYVMKNSDYLGSTCCYNAHIYDLTGGVGQEPLTEKCLYQWLMSDYVAASNSVPNGIDPGTYDLFLGGTAEVASEGFLGYILRMKAVQNDRAEAPILSTNFKFIGQQLVKAAGTDTDSIEVSSHDIFRHSNQYRMAYTGTGLKLYEEVGTITGDLFESSNLTEGVTFTIGLNLPADTSAKFYCSWTKRTNWIEQDPSFSAGDAVYNFYVPMPEGTTDIFYNVKWKMELYSNPLVYTKSPILKSLVATYNDTSYPSQEFLDVQDAVIGIGISAAQPIFKVELVLDGTSISIPISDKIEKNGIGVDREVANYPTEFNNLFIDSVTIKVENSDGYFSQYKANSPFYNRDYTNDEIRFFSGFQLSGGPEYLVTGRYYINKIITDSDSYAQIYCTSILNKLAEIKIGESVDDETTPEYYPGSGLDRVQDIMMWLLNTKGGIPVDNIHLPTYTELDQSFSPIAFTDIPIGDALQKLAQACKGLIYTSNQGDIYFKQWTALSTNVLHFQESTNYRKLELTGTDRSRLIKKMSVTGSVGVEGICSSLTLTYGKHESIDNDYIQRKPWAEDIADDIINRYGFQRSDLFINSLLTIKACYLPSIDILQTITVSSVLNGLSSEKYLIYRSRKAIVDNFEDEYDLMTQFAILT